MEQIVGGNLKAKSEAALRRAVPVRRLWPACAICSWLIGCGASTAEEGNGSLADTDDSTVNGSHDAGAEAGAQEGVNSQDVSSQDANPQGIIPQEGNASSPTDSGTENAPASSDGDADTLTGGGSSADEVGGQEGIPSTDGSGETSGSGEVGSSGGTSDAGDAGSAGGMGDVLPDEPISRWETRSDSPVEWLPSPGDMEDLIVYDDGGHAALSSNALQRYDNLGLFQWNYREDGRSRNRRGALGADGHVFTTIVGESDDEVFLVKVSPEGEAVWSVPGEHFVALTLGPEGEIATVHHGGLVQKRSPTGELLWENTVGAEFDVAPEGIVVAPDGRITVAGSTTGNTGERRNSDGWIAQFESGGDVAFETTFGSDSYDEFIGVALNAVGLPVAVGSSDSDLDGDGDDWEEILLVTFSNEGVMQDVVGIEKDTAAPPWSNVEHPYDMGLSAAGDIVIVSGYLPGDVTWAALVTVITPDGQLLQGTPVVDSLYLDGFLLGVGPNGHVLVAGRHQNEDFFLARLMLEQ